MKKIFALFLFVITALPFFATAQATTELPFGVSPKEISLSGTIDIPDSGSFGWSHGKLLDSYEWKEGNRTGIQLSSVSYSLNFWNVGKLGGTSGYLFWKKDFAHATLVIEYNVSANGQIITEKVDNSKFKLPDGWKLEPAESEPEIPPASCGLSFSGGPKGTFKGTCNNGSTIEGRVASGSFVIFDKISSPSDPKENSVGLTTILSKDLRLNGEFSDWKFDESTLEDSGARFSSMTGEVEVRHENDTDWDFCKLDTVLYVLDHVKTGEESQAIIGFSDLSTFLLKDESEIVITTPPKKNSKIGLVMGNIKANVKKMWNEGTMEVDMSQAVAGIKGTRFELTETGTESTIRVTEGLVAFRSKVDNKIEMVAAGESVTATKTGLGTKTTFDAKVADELLIKETTPLNNKEVEQKTSTGSNTVTVISVGVLALILGTISGVAMKKMRK